MRRVWQTLLLELWPVCGAYIAEVKGWMLTGRGFSGFMPSCSEQNTTKCTMRKLTVPEKRGLCLQSVVWISPLWENISEEGFESFSVEPNMLEVTRNSQCMDTIGCVMAS